MGFQLRGDGLGPVEGLRGGRAAPGADDRNGRAGPSGRGGRGGVGGRGGGGGGGGGFASAFVLAVAVSIAVSIVVFSRPSIPSHVFPEHLVDDRGEVREEDVGSRGGRREAAQADARAEFEDPSPAEARSQRLALAEVPHEHRRALPDAAHARGGGDGVVVVEKVRVDEVVVRAGARAGGGGDVPARDQEGGAEERHRVRRHERHPREDETADDDARDDDASGGSARFLTRTIDVPARIIKIAETTTRSAPAILKRPFEFTFSRAPRCTPARWRPTRPRRRTSRITRRTLTSSLACVRVPAREPRPVPSVARRPASRSRRSRSASRVRRIRARARSRSDATRPSPASTPRLPPRRAPLDPPQPPKTPQ